MIPLFAALCFTTLDGIQVYAPDDGCPKRYFVEEAIAQTYQRAGEAPWLSGNILEFTGTPLVSCETSAFGCTRDEGGIQISQIGTSEQRRIIIHEIGHQIRGALHLPDDNSHSDRAYWHRVDPDQFPERWPGELDEYHPW